MGGTVETLRITLNGEASADLEREEIEQSGRPAEEIAAEASEILRQQLYWFVQEAYRL